MAQTAPKRRQIEWKPRQELLAVSDRGEWLQLTDDPAIEARDVRWSPSGTHLIYNFWTMDKQTWYRLNSSHVYRAAADGSGKIDLTTQMTFCYALGWVNP